MSFIVVKTVHKIRNMFSTAYALLPVIYLFALFSLSPAVVLPDSIRTPVNPAGLCCYHQKNSNVCNSGVCPSPGASDWCTKSKASCENDCKGRWCPSNPQASATAPAKAGYPSQSSHPTAMTSDSGNAGHGTAHNSTSPANTANAGGNVFEGTEMYINPTFIANIDATLQTAAEGSEKENLLRMRTAASAYWLDRMEKVDPDNTATTTTAAGILLDASRNPTPPVVTLVVYDLPNRDCMAGASNGEICCGATTETGSCNYTEAASDGQCGPGLDIYRQRYIDPLAVSVRRHCGAVPMALVIEPDSLPNLVTNNGSSRCGNRAVRAAYRSGIRYAVEALSAACPSAALYLDGAHGGWLGWPDSLAGFMREVRALGVAPLLRGFALNVANYQPLGARCPAVGHCTDPAHAADQCCADPCGLAREYNVAHSELNYAAALGEAARKHIPDFVPRFLIDTGRNGAPAARGSCSSWCNPRGAGAGTLPTANTTQPFVDAFHWLKTPGESDGCTQITPDGERCRRFDDACAGDDSIGTRPGEPRAPEAGAWFDYQIKMLARNAQL